jgi:hypothetical protein
VLTSRAGGHGCPLRLGGGQTQLTRTVRCEHPLTLHRTCLMPLFMCIYMCFLTNTVGGGPSSTWHQIVLHQLSVNLVRLAKTHAVMPKHTNEPKMLCANKLWIS